MFLSIGSRQNKVLLIKMNVLPELPGFLFVYLTEQYMK